MNVVLCLGLIASILAADAAETALPSPAPSGASNSPAASILKFRVAPGLKVDLFAAEPMVQNIVSFAFDEQGRCYVVETHRRRTSVFDIRSFPEWLDADYSLRTVEDRENFFKRTLTPENQPTLDNLSRVKHGFLPDLNHDGVLDWHDLQVESERIRLLVDTNADGHADIATTIAEGFDGITSGVAAGVLARKGDLWFTCIPDLWRFRVAPVANDHAENSVTLRPGAETAKKGYGKLIHGFGVHIASGGHDLHGLKMGPDGKIYFSIADRGTSTNLWDKIIDHWPGLTPEALADSGAVFRCDPDGTQLEVVAIGLRNPQELAFDEFGNLFTGDNNSDFGDKSRWEYIVQGADYGWRIGWQWLPKAGAWNSEMLWGMAPSNTSAYYLPPVAHIAAGPAGTAYYPGTGLPARYDKHFFLCDFRGGANSLVHTFTLRPKGASFEAFDEKEFISGFLCTDVDFGLDGAVYVSDWVKGWEKTGQGRIYRVFDPNLVNDPAVLEVKRLLGEGMAKQTKEGLARLLGHRDMRVRLEAQFALVEKKEVETLEKTARSNSSELARVNAIQGLVHLCSSQAAEQPKQQVIYQRIYPTLESLLSDANPEIRAQAIRGIAAGKMPAKTEKKLAALLQDTSARVRFAAAEALGKQKRGGAALLELLRNNKDGDAYVRHAAVFALARIGNVPALLAAAKDASPGVRLGACLALRRLQRAEIGQLLQDSDPQIVLEAARAINDVPIPDAMLTLAQQLPAAVWRAEYQDSNMFTPVLRRSMNAHFRLGRKEDALDLALFAGNNNAPEALRSEALELLALWRKPPGRDPIVGLWRPLPARDDIRLGDVEGVLSRFETNPPATVKLGLKRALSQLSGKEGEAVSAPTTPEEMRKLAITLESGSVREKQGALAALAASTNSAAAQTLTAWLDKLIAQQVPKELQLDVIEAVQKSESLVNSSVAAQKLAKFEAARDPKDPLAPWRECLYGGNADEGRKAFIERQDVACFRCHKVNGEGGEVGPELAGIGQRQSRDYILESILFPNAKIAPGFESVIVTLKNGQSYGGVLKSEHEKQVIIQSPEDGLLTLKKSDIQARDRSLSAMPEGITNALSRLDLRNLVEFLATTAPTGVRPTDANASKRAGH
jgi:quinoprotein glucose dehydrogenase